MKKLTSATNNAANNNRRRRAQGALEYLMSYGWAILLVVMIGGSLYALGVFNPATFIGSRSATGFTTFQITDWALAPDSFTFLLGNKYGEQITVTSINATRKGTSYSCIYTTPAKELPVGTEAAFSISDPSLVLDLSMDSASSADNSTPDSSTYGNTARFFNYTRSCFGPQGCPRRSASGKLNSAIQLDGKDDYVNVSSSGSLDTVSSQLTIEAWLNTNSLSKRQTIVANWFYNKTAVPNIGNRSYVLTLETSGKFELLLTPLGNGTGATWLISNTSTSPNQWVHVAAVSNGTNASIYLNGVLDGTGGSPPILYVSHLPLYLGMWFAEEAYTDPYTTLFNGTLDEVRIYNRALPPDEIVRHYNMNYGAACASGLSKGKPYTLDVKIDFTSQSGMPHTDFGTITGKAE